MNRQQSFINNNKTLYVVATPIGNLNEMTPRAIEILKQCEYIACEDTRTTKLLLDKFDINTKCISHHLHNEVESTKGILDLFKTFDNIALVSDAGYPLISDPGNYLVTTLVETNINVVPVSGASAVLNSLVASGLSTQSFLFHGFLDGTDSNKKELLLKYKEYDSTLIFYESPHRIKSTLNLILETLGNRKICLARELTKKYEEFIRGNVSEILEIVDDIKGEMVLVIDKQDKEIRTLNDNDIIDKVNELIDQGIHSKEAIKKVSKDYNLNKKDVYNLIKKK